MDGSLAAAKSGRLRHSNRTSRSKGTRTRRSRVANRAELPRSPRRSTVAAVPPQLSPAVSLATAPLASAPAANVPPLSTAPAPRRPAIREALPTAAPHCVAVSGAAGDHPLVQQLLQTVFPGAARDAFATSLEDPFYEPHDRLLVKRGEQVVSHALVTRREMHFGEAVLPVGGLHALATLPEFRRQGHGRQLLRLAQSALADDGAVSGWLSTRNPHFFRPLGWAVCGRHSRARARTRDLLAQLSTAGWTPGPGPYAIRPWRQVELPALERLYAANTHNAYGPLLRTEAYWRWLVSRQDATQVLVAIHGPDKMDLNSSLEPIVGYAVCTEDRILELMVSPAHPSARQYLLARACGDLIERDQHTIELHCPPNDPLLEHFRHAGGSLSQSEQHEGEVYMAWLADPIGFLHGRCPQLHQHADRARLSRPAELGLDVEGSRQRIVLSRRNVRVTSGRLGRHNLRLGQTDFTRLLLGQLDVPQAVAHGRIRSSSRTATTLATTLFPRFPWWRPPLDDLLMSG